MAKKNKNETFEQKFVRKHTVVSKKALIIGSICAGTVAAGGTGAAIYFGVTRGNNVVDNSITYEEANEFGKKNYMLYSDFTAGNYNAKSATVSWDFSKTDFGDEDTKTVWNTTFWNSIFQLVLSDHDYQQYVGETPTKIDNAEAHVTMRSYTILEPYSYFSFFTNFSLYKDDENDENIFFTKKHCDLKKNGDEITFTTIHKFGNLDNDLTITLNKNGTIKKGVMPIYGDITSAAEITGFFKGSFTVDFTY